MRTILTFVTFTGGFRLDRVVDEGKGMAMFDILCEQPEGMFADAILQSEDVISPEDMQYYLALAEQNAQRDL